MNDLSLKKIIPAAFANGFSFHVKKWASLESFLLAAMFFAAVLLPPAEMTLRSVLKIGIEGASSIVQHLILAVGMLGAAIATREDRLLTLSLSHLIEGRIGNSSRLFNRTVSAIVSILLLLNSVDFIAAEFRSGMIWTHGIPVWVAELPLAVGFFLIVCQLVWQTSPSLIKKVAIGTLSMVASLLIKKYGPGLPYLEIPGIVLLFLAALMGAPLFVAIGGTALFLLMANGVPTAAIAVDHYSLVMNSSLPAIPMFTLSGYLLAKSSAPARLVRLFKALLGKVPGGAAITTVLVCTFFTSFTGASGVTVLALGGLVMPLLKSTGYSQENALGLVTSAGLPGTLLMPALPLILYAIVSDIGIHEMFMGGILPAFLFAGLIAVLGIFLKESGLQKSDGFDFKELWLAVIHSVWELSIPLVPIIALISGFATPTESAALTCCYVLFVTVLIRKDLKIGPDLTLVVRECGLIVGGILLIMGLALGLTDYFVDAQIPDRITDWVSQRVHSKYLFLLALNVFLLAAGALMEIYPAIMVLAPLVSHLGQTYDLNRVHLGMIFLSNMELGYLTPLVGLNLFFAGYRFDKPVFEVFKAILPFFFIIAAGVLIVTYFPYLSTALILWIK